MVLDRARKRAASASATRRLDGALQLGRQAMQDVVAGQLPSHWDEGEWKRWCNAESRQAATMVRYVGRFVG